VYAVLGRTIATALAAGDAALADRATTLVHVGLAFLVADAANVIARGVLRGASDVRYAAVVGIATSWLTTPPLTWLLGLHLGWGVVGGWIGLALEIFVGASLFWWRVYRGGWRPAAAAARRVMAGTAV
jgi:multidrug resistance protein, MATE family